MIPLFLNYKCEMDLNHSSNGFILMDMEDNHGNINQDEHSEVRCVRKIDGEIVNCSRFVTKNYVCYYVAFYDISKMQLNNMRKAGGAITKNLTTWLKLGKHSTYDDIVSDRLAEGNSYENFVYQYSLRNKINRKITQYHHLHVRLVDLYCNKDSVTLYGYEAALAMYLDRFSDVEATHCTFLLYYKALPINEKLLFEALLYSYKCVEKKWLKEEGVRAKQTQHATSYDMSKIFELNVLENRVDEEIDWSKEKNNRVNPDTVCMDYSKVYALAVRLFAAGRSEGQRPFRSLWSDYWAQRAIIMPGGAVHSEHECDKKTIAMLPRAAKNKKGFVSTLGELNQDYFLDRRQEICAHVSTKYEWGKTRALYGCDITSHIHADFGLMGCEDTFPLFIPTGSGATPENVNAEMKCMNGIPLCYDYDDFNSQHSVESMKAVISAWRDVYSDLLTDEQHQSCIWTRGSLDNMVVVNSMTNDVYAAKGTLFSGWRLTSFINTALNYVYLDVSNMRLLTYKSLHNGDDVFASTSSLGTALKLVENAERNGARAQISKMNIGTIAEFLRMDIKAKNPLSAQYLTRGCATMVHSRIESEAPYSLRSIVQAYKSRYDELISRGAATKVMKRLYRKQLFFARLLFNASKDVIEALITYDLSAGGLVKNGVLLNSRIEDKVLEVKDNDLDTIKTLTHKGLVSYCNYLKTKFNTISNAFSMSAVTNNAMRMYNIYRSTCVIVDATRLQLVVEKNLRGAWLDKEGISVVHKLRMGISNIVMAIDYVSPELAHLLWKSGDVLKWIQILL